MRAHPLPLALAILALLGGCDQPSRERAPASAAPVDGSAPPATGTYGVPIGIPGPTDKIVSAVNPERQAPYAGPKGTLRGVVRIDGDPPPETGLKFPDRCKDSEAAYGKLFRVGLDKTLGDAIVAVTGYAERGFVPAAGEAYKVTIHNCVPSRRTYVITYGQRIEVANLDTKDSYSPYLDGLPIRSVMVALPNGEPVKIYPTAGSKVHYMLRDQLQSGLVADVFVVNYATHDVTGLDGQYEIKGIPVGKVTVNASLPIVDKADGKEIEIKEGDNTLDFTLHFDASKDDPARKRAAAASASPKAPPSGAPKPPKQQ